MSGFNRLNTNNGILGGYDFVDRNPDVYAYTGNAHGTWVLSDMAGYVQDQFVGTAPDAEYYLFRTENAATETPIEETLWVEAALVTLLLIIQIIVILQPKWMGKPRL